MNCPVDAEPMLAIEHEGIEIDYCPACQGMWLDAGELELLLGDPAARRELIGAGHDVYVPETREKRRKCPRCSARMTKVAGRSDAGILYDECPHGDGLWFDQGELQALLSSDSLAGAGDQVIRFLRDLFSYSRGPDSEDVVR